MQIQKSLLSTYMEVSNHPTFKKISQETGVQMTRVFRLFNGSSMKLSEYVTFQKLVDQKLGFNNGLSKLVKECSNQLSPEGLKEVAAILQRKISLSRLATEKDTLHAFSNVVA